METTKATTKTAKESLSRKQAASPTKTKTAATKTSSDDTPVVSSRSATTTTRRRRSRSASTTPLHPLSLIRDPSDSTASVSSDEREADHQPQPHYQYREQVSGETGYEQRNNNTATGRRSSLIPGRLCHRRTSINLMEYFECSMPRPLYKNRHERNRTRLDERRGWSFFRSLLPSSMTSIISVSDTIDHIQNIHYFWTSPVMLRSYALILSSLVIQQYWVLQAVSFLVVMKMIRLVTDWVFYVWHAPNVRRLKSLIFWWVGFGLDFASKTVSDGHGLHKFAAVISYNTFVSGFGKDIAIGAIKELTQVNKEKFLARARDRVDGMRQHAKESLTSTIDK